MSDDAIHIVDIETGERVHSIEPTHPRGSSAYRKFIDGLGNKVDFNRFYISTPEDREEEADPEEGQP